MKICKKIKVILYLLNPRCYPIPKQYLHYPIPSPSHCSFPRAKGTLTPYTPNVIPCNTNLTNSSSSTRLSNVHFLQPFLSLYSTKLCISFKNCSLATFTTTSNYFANLTCSNISS